MQTIRVATRGHGRMRMNVNTPAVNDSSVVVVTASETRVVGNNPHHRFMGDADVWVSNIAPHGPPFDPNNGVEWILHIDWPSDLDVLVDVTGLDSPVGPIVNE